MTWERTHSRSESARVVPCKLQLASEPNVRLQKPLMSSGNWPLPKATASKPPKTNRLPRKCVQIPKKLLRLLLAAGSARLFALLALEAAGSIRYVSTITDALLPMSYSRVHALFSQLPRQPYTLGAQENYPAVQVTSCCYTCYDEWKGPLRPVLWILLTLIAYRMMVWTLQAKTTIHIISDLHY